MRHSFKNGLIVADRIEIGEGVRFEGKFNVNIRGKLQIGDYSRFGDCDIKGNNVWIGKHFYHSNGLRVGGGGRNGPNANLRIGDRCVMHNNFINVCEPVLIGDDVGLSEEVTILTHGYWQSVLDGYPAKFAGVTIGDGVIVGYRSIILPGITIGDNTVIGAGSTVTKDITGGIWAGNPVRFIRDIEPLNGDDREREAYKIYMKFLDYADYHDLRFKIDFKYPVIWVDGFGINLNNYEYMGEETEITDKFRDFIRRYGIRIYTKRPFG